jgi:hypothetical protein
LWQWKSQFPGLKKKFPECVKGLRSDIPAIHTEFEAIPDDIESGSWATAVSMAKIRHARRRRRGSSNDCSDVFLRFLRQ